MAFPSPGLKLQFDGLPLHGRKTELKMVRDAAERVDRLKRPELLLVSGSSGSGKTSLVNEMKEESWGRYFIYGKFDQFHERPYAAIVDALNDLCDQVANSDNLKDVRTALCKELGKEDSVIRNALPHVERILGEVVGTRSDDMQCFESFSFYRLKISFRAVLQAAMSVGKSIIMFIDDLHWADAESFELLQNIAKDTELSQLLLAVSYRDDDITPKSLKNVEALEASCTSTIVHLDDFDVKQLNGLVAAVLNMSMARTEPLSQIIHPKTAGNPHFTLQFMKAAEKQKLISYSMDNFCWEWEIEKIQSDTDVADNIVDIFVEKIDSLSPDARIALIIGSCLGAKFDALVVELLLISIAPPNLKEIMGRERLMNALEVASKEGVVDRQRGSSVYRFSHDKVHQAFYSLVPEVSQPDKLHLRIGQSLLKLWNAMEPKEDWMTFLAAAQLNKASHLITSTAQKVELAQLNLEAAKAALNTAAFRPSSEHLHQGLDLVRTLGWSCYDLRLELMTMLSRTECCLGNFKECHNAVNEVIQNARTVEEKIPAFRICVESYGAESRVDECIREGMLFVKQLGVKLPKKFNKLSVIFALVGAKKLLKGKTEDELLNYPLANDPRKIAAVRIMNTMATFAFHARLANESAAFALINTQLIMAHGFTDEAGAIMATYGFLLAWTGDFDEGYRYGQIALKLGKSSKSGIPRTTMNYYNGLDHLKHPLHESLEPLLQGYQAGFQVGDTLYGCYCCHFYLSIFYFVGLPLKNLLRDMESFSKEMKVYNMQTTLDFLRIYHQSVINLSSGDDSNTLNPTTLTGTAMREEDILRSSVKQTVEALWFGKLILGLYFNDYEVISAGLQKLVYERPPDLDGCMHYVNVLLWTEAFGALLVARRTGKRKYRVLADKRIKKIEQWVKKGNVNCHHFLLHLYAERIVFRKKTTPEVKRAFDGAITASRRAGFVNTAALANERAAMYFLEQNDSEWAGVYMVSAYELYDDWGATAKRNLLLQEHGDLLTDKQTGDATSSSGSKGGTSHRGRKRHTSVLNRMHEGGSLEFAAVANNSNGDFSDSGSWAAILEESTGSFRVDEMEGEDVSTIDELTGELSRACEVTQEN